MSKRIKKMKRKLNKIRAALGIKMKYKIGNLTIDLPSDHLLPEYQKDHPDYDRFLPHLVSYLNEGDVVVDVGANVGDTLAGMLSKNSKLKYVCIEADHSFYLDCVENINKFKNNLHTEIYAINAFVGADINNVSLESGKAGTKHAVISEKGNIISKPLDNIINELNFSEIRLLKTDVDGFDYDVIKSAEHILKTNPLIFFECQHEYLNQLEGFQSLFEFLATLGYSNFAIFNNYGQFILNTVNLETINQLLNYVMKQNERKSTRTIHYFDILAYNEKDSKFIENVLTNY